MIFIITIIIVSIILGVYVGIKIEKYLSLKRLKPKDVKYMKSYCDMAVLVKVDSIYSNNLESVEFTVCDVAKEVMEEVIGGIPEFEPFIRLVTFSDFSIDLIVILRTKSIKYRCTIKSEFIKRLQKRFDEDGMDIIYPIRSINLKVAKL